MSLLTIIQNVCEDLVLAKPTTVIGNSNSQVTQLLQLAQREGRDLASRYRWQALLRQNSFTLDTGQANQGAMNGTIVTDSDFEYILNDNMWNQTTSERIIGPLNDREIESYEAFTVTGPYSRWYMLGDDLYIVPTPTSADTAQFQYKSTSWCESAAGAGQAKWTADTDVGRLNENIMELGIIWRWLRRKGMDYSEEFNAYERRVTDATNRDGGKRKINLAGGSGNLAPGIFVPQTGFGS